MKLSKKQFFSILRDNAALYSRTARAIKKKYGVEISRHSVRERALRYPDLLRDIQEENVDVAEESLHSLMRSKNENVRIRAVELFLKTKGRHRGYVTEQNINIDFDRMNNEELSYVVDQLLKGIK